jgi:HTH-type transcriptional regulator/antitoxin HigA
MMIRPIRTPEDYEAALEQAASLMDAKAGTPEGDALDVLATLLEAYERKHFPVESPDPVEAIRFVMEQRELKRCDIEEYLGSKSRVSEILGHKRSLTLPMIRKLHHGLGIPAEALIAETVLRRAPV